MSVGVVTSGTAQECPQTPPAYSITTMSSALRGPETAPCSAQHEPTEALSPHHPSDSTQVWTSLYLSMAVSCTDTSYQTLAEEGVLKRHCNPQRTNGDFVCPAEACWWFEDGVKSANPGTMMFGFLAASAVGSQAVLSSLSLVPSLRNGQDCNSTSALRGYEDGSPLHSSGTPEALNKCDL